MSYDPILLLYCIIMFFVLLLLLILLRYSIIYIYIEDNTHSFTYVLLLVMSFDFLVLNGWYCHLMFSN